VRSILLVVALAAKCATGAEGDAWHELGLRRGHATQQQVRAAYLRLAKELHPDKNREGVARGADKTERFKRVQRAYEEITSAGAEPAAQDPHQAASVSSTARRAGSMAAQQPAGEEGRRNPAKCSGGGGIISGEAFDMRVFTDSVGLEDMEEDPDEGGFTLTCRCGGTFLLPWKQAADHPGRRAAVNCQLCSLWIWVEKQEGGS
jgi:hypothetical protein